MKLGFRWISFPISTWPILIDKWKENFERKKIVNNVFVSSFFFFSWTISVLLKCWSQNGYAQTGIKRVCGQVNSIVYQRQEVNKTLELGSGKSERLWFQLNSHQYSIGTPTQSHLIFIWGNSVGEFIYLFIYFSGGITRIQISTHTFCILSYTTSNINHYSHVRIYFFLVK